MDLNLKTNNSKGVHSRQDLEQLSRAVGSALGEEIRPEDFTFFQSGEKIVLKADKLRVAPTCFARNNRPRIVWNTLDMTRAAINAYLQAGRETMGVTVRQAENIRTEKGILIKSGIEIQQTDDAGDLVAFYARVKKIIEAGQRR